MVFTRIFRCKTRMKKRQDGNRFYMAQLVCQTTGPPICLRFRNSTNRPNISQILRQDGCSERLLPNSPGQGILHEDNIPPPKRKIQIPPHTPRPQCLFRRMVSRAKKIVDDILVWAPSLPELKIRVETIAHNCKNLNITLSKKKFEVGKQIQFAGYLVGEDG